MRFLTIAATILVGLVADSTRGTAHPPPHYYGYGWYGHPYGYYQPVVPYVVQRPIIVAPAFSGLPIKITNPATNSATLSYALNGVTYSIPPGHSQDLTVDRSWVISFGRGGNFGTARYGLEAGLYTFASTDHGWESYHGELRRPARRRQPRIRRRPPRRPRCHRRRQPLRRRP